jgi:hypothetical protein
MSARRGARGRRSCDARVRYRPGSSQGRRHLANEGPVHFPFHATAISAKNSGLCVTAARLRLGFQVAPRPNEWPTAVGATGTARRTMAAGMTRNRGTALHT